MRCSSHRLDELVVEPLGAGVDALLEHDVHRGLDELGVAFVEHEEDVAVAGLKLRSRLDRVVEAQHGRRGAAAQDPPARLEAVAERREPERGALLGRAAPDAGAAARR